MSAAARIWFAALPSLLLHILPPLLLDVFPLSFPCRFITSIRTTIICLTAPIPFLLLFLLLPLLIISALLSIWMSQISLPLSLCLSLTQ